MQTLHIKNADELDSVVEVALDALIAKQIEKQASVLAISGDLGAGKTTFMQALALKLHITNTVISPTYVIMKKYEIDEEEKMPFRSLVHIDAYRIESIDEMRPIRFDEILSEEKTLVCIEWAERIKELLPPHTIYMDIKIDSEESRSITFA